MENCKNCIPSKKCDGHIAAQIKDILLQENWEEWNTAEEDEDATAERIMNLSISLEIIMDIGKDAQDQELLLHLGRLKDLQERVEDLKDMILAEFQDNEAIAQRPADGA